MDDLKLKIATKEWEARHKIVESQIQSAKIAGANRKTVGTMGAYSETIGKFVKTLKSLEG